MRKGVDLVLLRKSGEVKKMFKHDTKEFKKIIDEVQTEKKNFFECQYMRESSMRTGKNNKQSRDT